MGVVCRSGVDEPNGPILVEGGVGRGIARGDGDYPADGRLGCVVDADTIAGERGERAFVPLVDGDVGLPSDGEEWVLLAMDERAVLVGEHVGVAGGHARDGLHVEGQRGRNAECVAYRRRPPERGRVHAHVRGKVFGVCAEVPIDEE